MTRRLGVAGAIWTASLLLSRLIGLVRERTLGRTLGAGVEADVYAAAFRIPDLFFYLLAGGALSIVFIPIFTAHLERGDERRAWRSFSVIANTLLVAALALIPALLWAMPSLTRLAAPGFTGEQAEHLVRLTRIVLPAQIFHMIGGLLGASLLARDRHIVPALSPLLYNIGIIAGGLISGSAEGFAWGVLAGAFAGSFALPLWVCLRGGLKWTPAFSVSDPDLRDWLRMSLPIMLGWSIVAMDDPLITRFASRLGAGETALLNYAKTLMRVPMGVFGAAMAYAAYPTLARLFAQGRTAELRGALASAIERVLLLAFASQVILTAGGPEIGTLVYTARRIPPADLETLGLYLSLFSVGLPAWSLQILLSRGFYARRRAWLPTWLGTGIMVLFVPVYWQMGERFGGAGLAVTSALAISTYALLLAALLHRELDREERGAAAGPGAQGESDGSPRRPARRTVWFAARGLAACLAGTAAGLWAARLLGAPATTAAGALGRLFIIGGAGTAVYGAVAAATGILPVARALAAFSRRRGRGANGN